MMVVRTVQLFDVNIHPCGITDGIKEFPDHLCIHIAAGRTAEIRIEDQIRAASQIDGAQNQSFIHRQQKVSVSCNARFFTQGFRDRFSHDDTDIFDGVMAVDLQIPLAAHLKVEESVAGKTAQHVVEKLYPSIDLLFSGTIQENLRWGEENATLEECVRACQLACADDFIEQFPDKYDTHIEQGGTNVSGGQKQRLCIARALLKKPKILILDDSTSAVDTATDARIRKSLAREIPDTTKLIIAQRISSVRNADRIIVMENGRVNGFGTHEELLAGNEIYRDVYESQMSGSGDFDENGGEA